jgi:rhomboid family protein
LAFPSARRQNLKRHSQIFAADLKVTMIPIRGTVPSKNPPIATWVLILANTVVFLVELGIPSQEVGHVFYLFGIVPARYTHPDWAMTVDLATSNYWPFLTSMFVHGSWVHILANMWTLWIFGDNVEDRMGPARFVVFYLLCGVAGSVAHVLANPDSTMPTLGASGAVAGVLGAYLILFPYARLIVLIPIFLFPFVFEIPAVFFIGFWALSQLFGGTLSLASRANVGGIAWWGHVGGFAAGIVLQIIFVNRGNAYLPERRHADDDLRGAA